MTKMLYIPYFFTFILLLIEYYIKQKSLEKSKLTHKTEKTIILKEGQNDFVFIISNFMDFSTKK